MLREDLQEIQHWEVADRQLECASQHWLEIPVKLARFADHNLFAKNDFGRIWQGLSL